MANGKITCRVSKRNIVEGTTQQRNGLRVTIDSPGTLTTKQMAADINHACSLTQADVLGVIEMLKTMIINGLQHGQTVVLDGIGSFTLGIGTKEIMYEDEIVRGTDICAKGVVFRPAASLTEQMQDISYTVRQDISIPLNEAQIRDALRAYMEDESHGGLINTKRFATLCHCSESGARKRTRQCCADGLLAPSPHARFCYVAGPNLFD